MDNNEAFEKWARTAKINDLSLEYPLPLTTYELTSGYSNSRTQAAWLAWQAAQQQSADEIANLMMNIEAQEKLGYELQADNERLREALQFYADGRHFDYCDKQSSERFGLDWVVEYGDIADEALSATTIQGV